MTWEELIKAACIEADNSMLENEYNESYEFSKKHIARMKRLARSVGRPLKISAMWRGVAVAAICLCFLGLTTGVYAIGSRIIEWHSTVTDKGTNIAFDISDKESVPERIEKEYVLSVVPEGFEQTDESEKPYKIEKSFTNGETGLIVFSQYCYMGFSGSYNTENAISEEIDINGECGFYIETQNEKIVIWENGEYVFMLLCSGDFSKEDVMGLASSVIAQEE